MQITRPTAQLSPTLTLVTGTPVPMSIGADGYLYAIKGGIDGAVICRTNDGFQTVEDGQDMTSLNANAKVRGVTKTQAGYVVVCEVGGGAGEIYFSEAFDSGFVKVLDMTTKARGMGVFWHNTDPAKQICMVCEYSGTLEKQHKLYVSTDGGASWTTSYTTTVTDPLVVAHTHTAIYDPTSGKMFLSVGDGNNRLFLVSDDLGQTWGEFTDYQINTKDAWRFSADYKLYQPTVIIPTGRGLTLMPDTVFTPSVYTLDRNTTPWTLSWNTTTYWGASTAQFFATAPFAQSGDEAYFIYPNNADPTQHFVVGSGDGGNTWHTLAEVRLTAAGSMNYGIVGPDAGGYLYAYCKDAGVDYVWKALKPEWVSA